jgi:hypothetical protein
MKTTTLPQSTWIDSILLAIPLMSPLGWVQS